MWAAAVINPTPALGVAPEIRHVRFLTICPSPSGAAARCQACCPWSEVLSVEVRVVQVMLAAAVAGLGCVDKIAIVREAVLDSIALLRADTASL